MHSWMRDYPRDAVFFHEGEPGNVAFILTEGSVEIVVGSGEGRRTVTVLKPVAVFGEMALVLKDQKRTATAVATSDCKVAVITKVDFDDFLAKSPKLIGAALSALVTRLQKTTAKIAKAPSLFLGTSHIIDLLNQHSVQGIKYDPAAAMIRVDLLRKAVAQAFLVEQNEVDEVITQMESLGLIEFHIQMEAKYINITDRDNFLKRCVKVYETILKMAVYRD